MKTHTLLITLLASLCFAACGGDDEPAVEAKATTSPPAFGVYTREVTKADIERTMDERNDAPGFEPSPTGRFQLTIAQRGGIDVVKVTDPNGMTIEMDAKVDGNELRLIAYAAPEKGVFCDQAIPALAKYELTVQDAAIALEPSAEECADRDSVLTGTWTKG